MSDTGYWQGLRRVGVVLYLSFFFLFLGVAIFVYFADYLSGLEIWDSPVWIEIRAPLLVVGVSGFVAGVVALARFQGKKRLQAARQHAEAQGWAFSRDDTQGLTATAAGILWDLKNITLSDIRTVERGQRSLHLFDCSYKYEQDTASRSYSHGVASMVQSERFRSVAGPLTIVERDWSEVMISDKVDMGVSGFAEKFLVLSRDPYGAKRTVSDAIQATMLGHLKGSIDNPVSVTLGRAGAVVMTGRTDEPARLQDLIALARAIEAEVG